MTRPAADAPATTSRRRPVARKAVPVLAAGPLALLLVAGCGSSGSDSGSGDLTPPSASSAPSSPSAEPTPSETPTESPSPSDSPSASESADSGSDSSSSSREFTDSESGLSFSVPTDYVLVTTPAEASAKLPSVFETATDGSARITRIRQQLAADTVMFAVKPESGGFNDNIGLQKVDANGLTNPSQIQSSTFKATARQELSKAGATDVQLENSELGDRAAVHVTYKLSASQPIAGEQYYVSAGDEKVYILTITAGSVSRAASAAGTVTDSWTFS